MNFYELGAADAQFLMGLEKTADLLPPTWFLRQSFDRAMGRAPEEAPQYGFKDNVPGLPLPVAAAGQIPQPRAGVAQGQPSKPPSPAPAPAAPQISPAAIRAAEKAGLRAARGRADASGNRNPNSLGQLTDAYRVDSDMRPRNPAPQTTATLGQLTDAYDVNADMRKAKPNPAGLANLGLGSRSNDVRALQAQLGFQDGDVDGRFGNKTRNAVMEMQRRLGFTGKAVDGIVGKNTRARMAKASPDLLAGRAPAAPPQAVANANTLTTPSGASLLGGQPAAAAAGAARPSVNRIGSRDSAVAQPPSFARPPLAERGPLGGLLAATAQGAPKEPALAKAPAPQPIASAASGPRYSVPATANRLNSAAGPTPQVASAQPASAQPTAPTLAGAPSSMAGRRVNLGR